MKLPPKIVSFISLARLNKPIGIWLFLWPMLSALWLAAGGVPPLNILMIFVLGVVVMRSAGCVINDFFDQSFDKSVERTKNRPLVTGELNSREAILFFLGLTSIAILLALQLNILSLEVAFFVFCLSFIYPLAKRFTYLPQFFLGAAVAGAVPMAFAAVQNQLPVELWWVYAMALLWPVMYDTLYAMVDRKDDAKIGVKSTALLFGKYDRFFVIGLQTTLLILLIFIGSAFSLRLPYYCAIAVVAFLFLRQNYLIRSRKPAACFKAFLENWWVGVVVFLGIWVSL